MFVNVVTAPWPRLIAPVILLGGGLLATSLTRTPAAPAPATGYQLVLETSGPPECYWGSAWNDGAVVVADREHEQTFVRTFDFIDDCTWEARETVTPQGDGTLAYRYTERVVSCRPSSSGAAKACTRAGTVTVEPGDALDPTPAVAATQALNSD